ncbi:MAG: DUF1592 domain-containing protein [Acidobacteria bacterium]|nr:DUF1592 domain-containing protein [Acidobacteriota bacterium]
MVAADLADDSVHAVDWEEGRRKLHGRVMPPIGRPRPGEAEYEQLTSYLEAELDGAWNEAPNPGRTQTFHRLNRAEYGNAVRDLLALDIEVDDFLPADDASYGFDNIAGVLRMSQALMERYLAAARTISRMAVGSPPPAVDSTVYRIEEDMQQQHRVEELPFGTRGGLLVEHFFPQTADYDIRIDVGNDRGLRDVHRMEVTVDGEPVRVFEVGQPPAETAVQQTTNTVVVQYATDGVYTVRTPVAGGPRSVGVTFYKQPTPLVEQVREVFENPTISNNAGVGGRMPTVTTVTVAGPYGPTGSGDTPSRGRIFVCRPATAAEEAPCAREILSRLVRRAYRGQVADGDVDVLLDFYNDGRAAGGSFDDGIELALRRLLVSPEFLYRIEADRTAAASSDRMPGAYARSDLELASRLSFFLWSSIPDDELLDVAEQGRLGEPAELERQVRRMLADPRSAALTENFAGQWLQLRNLETVVRPGDPYSRTFDESLRQGLLRETLLFIDGIMRDDRSLLEILTADYTFLNERVARHYGLLDVQGSHFRRVELPEDSPRRGLLGHGSVLTLTSHAIRTSPVNRGKWILDNILGTPPPDPPANVPALDDRKTQAKVATLRERMSAHRANPACASCHNIIDPTGFALENFDAVGRWRVVDESFNTIDASGVLPDGTPFEGVTDMIAALVRRPERFVTTVTEKLLTYALGRGVEHYDMPAVRRIVSEAAEDDFRFQTIVVNIVNSYPFRYRRAADAGVATAVAAAR